jgi:tRNA (guanine37-N1)-methyltransferase
MKYKVLTLYRDLIETYAHTGIIGRGVEAGAIAIEAYDIRSFTLDKHGSVDDSPYGGGAGMVMTPQPIYDAVQAAKDGKEIPVVFFSAAGRTLTAEIAKEYAQCEELILLCGHFEGVDQRVIDLCVTDEISVGDYVVTGGHIAAMCFMDAVSRYVPGVLGNAESARRESFEDGLLEYEQYTRPPEFRGLKVPDILLSGDHAKIETYRRECSLRRTECKRPDLIEKRNEKPE